MALDLTPKDLWEQVSQAVDLRRAHTENAKRLIRQYATPGYRKGFGTDGWENHPYQWINVIVPHLAWSTPGVRISDMGIEDEQTDALQTALRSWMEQVGIVDQLRYVAYDQQFSFGVLYTAMERTPGLKMDSEMIPMRPSLERMSPMLYFEDAQGPKFGMPRFAGHICIKDLRDMQGELNAEGQLKYDPVVLAKMGDQSDVQAIETDLIQHEGSSLAGIGKPVVLYEVWCRESKSLITLVNGGDGPQIVRQEREYQGAEDGPYTKFGTHIVPDQVYPLPPLAVTQKQVEELNRHREQASRDAATAKRLAMADGMSKEQVVKTANAMSGDVLMVPGFGGSIKTFEFGGPMKETLGYIDWSEGKLDRQSGLSNPLRGDVTGDATATENALAGQYADVRLKYQTACFTRDVANALRKVVGIMDDQTSVAFPVSGEASMIDPMTGGIVKRNRRGTFVGGPDGSTQGEPFPWKRQFTVKIEPYSMEYVNQSLLRLQTQSAQEHTLKIVAAKMQGAPINVDAMIDDMFETLNMPQTARKYVDENALAMMGAMQQGMAAVAAGGNPGQPARSGPPGPKQPQQSKTVSSMGGKVEAPV